MKPLQLDVDTNDYLHLTQAATIVRDHWTPHPGSVADSEICILQALAVAENFDKEQLILITPPHELIDLCRTRVEDQRVPLTSVLPWFKGMDYVWVYNDRVCESPEEAATMLEQAAELVLLRD